MSAGQIDEWARRIGFHVVSFVPVCDRMGWKGIDSARPYMHASDIPTGIFSDFLDVARRGVESPAASRLRRIAPEWGVDEPSLALAASRRAS